jgi:hypothetical protein
MALSAKHPVHVGPVQMGIENSRHAWAAVPRLSEWGETFS